MCHAAEGAQEVSRKHEAGMYIQMFPLKKEAENISNFGPFLNTMYKSCYLIIFYMIFDYNH